MQGGLLIGPARSHVLSGGTGVVVGGTTQRGRGAFIPKTWKEGSGETQQQMPPWVRTAQVTGLTPGVRPGGESERSGRALPAVRAVPAADPTPPLPGQAFSCQDKKQETDPNHEIVCMVFQKFADSKMSSYDDCFLHAVYEFPQTHRVTQPRPPTRDSSIARPQFP